MNSIKVNKKDIESDDEDFEDFEEEEITNEEDYEDDEITSEEAKTEEEEQEEQEEEQEESLSNSNGNDVLYEEYDLNRVCYLYKNLNLFIDKIYDKCKNKEELKKEENKLKNWLELVIINEGKIEVIYKETDGRSFGANSIQSISGYVRNFLLENKKVSDIDIENAICAILIPVFKKHNIECKTLEYYYKNRQEVINKFYKGNKQLCKDFINPSFFKNADKIITKNDFEKKIKKEIKGLQDCIYNLEEYERFNLKSIESCDKKGSENYKGTTLYNLYAYLENEVLKEAIHFYKKETKKKVMVKMFDGFIGEEDKNFSINELSDYITDIVKNKVIYTFKPIKNDINIIKPMPSNFTYDIEELNLKNSYFMSRTLIEKGALSIAKKIAYKLKIHLKYSCEVFYCFNKKTCLWYKTKEPSEIIIETINKHLDYSLNYHTTLLTKTSEEKEREDIQEKISFYAGIYKKLDCSSFYSMLIKHLKSILNDDEFIQKLDNKIYYLAFKNGLYNLRKNKFEYGLKDTDYLTETIPFNYNKSSIKDRQKVNDIIYKICNCNKEHLEYYLSVLGYSLIGDSSKEKSMYFLIGTKGNNGKTIILDATSCIMPNYCKKIDRQTFENDYKKSHKNLISVKGKRIIYLEELSEKKLNIEMLKEYADGNSLEVEKMYGTTEKINLNSKLFFCSNPTPNFKTDGGIANRYKQLSFNSSFEKHFKEDNYEKLEFEQDNTLLEQLKTNLKDALIDIYIEYANKYINNGTLNPPTEFINDQNNVLEMNDEVKLWIEEDFEVNPDFKFSKYELEQTKIFKRLGLKRITDDFKRLGYKYIKDLRKDGKKGIWIGLRLIENETEENNLNL